MLYGSAMVMVAIVFLIPVLMLVAGYLQLAEAVSRQAATGVVLIVLGTASGLWLLSSISW
jgi:drug/metabolite transporter (DMT)-like permease